MSDWHSFNPTVAAELGTDCATIFCFIDYWLHKNEMRRNNLRDEKYWTFNSCRGFEKEMPYYNRQQINRFINKLIKHNYLKVGNYNRRGGDRTRWFTLTDKGIKCAMYFKPCIKNESASIKSENSNVQNQNFENSDLKQPFIKNESALPTVTPKGNPNRLPNGGNNGITSRAEEPSRSDIQVMVDECLKSYGITETSWTAMASELLERTGYTPKVIPFVEKAILNYADSGTQPTATQVYRTAEKLFREQKNEQQT